MFITAVLIFDQHQMSKTNFKVSYESTVETTVEMKLTLKFYLCLNNFSELWNLFSRVFEKLHLVLSQTTVYIFRSQKRQKEGCKILQVTMVVGFGY